MSDDLLATFIIYIFHITDFMTPYAFEYTTSIFIVELSFQIRLWGSMIRKLCLDTMYLKSSRKENPEPKIIANEYVNRLI